jgi:hypothetical protein
VETGESGDTGEAACVDGFEPGSGEHVVVVEPSYDPACVDVVGTHVIDLPVATLSGVFSRADGGVVGYATLRGRSGQGDVWLPIADDGSYGVQLLPGSYDVLAQIGVTEVVVGEVTVAGATSFDLVLPASVQFSGRITAQDVAFGGLAHVDLAWPGGRRELATPDGPIDGGLEWDVRVAPGTYTLGYHWCIGPLESGGECSESPFYPLDCSTSPPGPLVYSKFVIDDALAITSDLHLERTLPTARLHGHLDLTGELFDTWGNPCRPALNLFGPKPGEGVVVVVDELGNFDQRVFAGDYTVHVGTTSGPIAQLDLHQDLAFDVAVATHELSAMLTPSIPTLGAWPDESELELRRADDFGRVRLSATADDVCTASSFGPVFPGVYELARRDGQPLGDVHVVDQQTATLTAEVPLARVQAEAVGMDDWHVALRRPGERNAGSLQPGEETVVVPGTYELHLLENHAVLGLVALTDQTRVQLDLTPQAPTLSLRIAGQVVDDGFSVWLQRRDAPHAGEPLLRGTHDVRYRWDESSPADVPQNRYATIGCVNLR